MPKNKNTFSWYLSCEKIDYEDFDDGIDVESISIVILKINNHLNTSL